MEAQKNEKDLSHLINQLESSVADLKERIFKLTAFDSTEEINKYCDNLECEIELTLDSAVKRLDTLKVEMLKEINDYRNRLLISAPTASAQATEYSSYNNSLSRLTQEINQFSSTILGRHNDANDSSANDFEAVKTQIEAFSTRARQQEVEMRKLLFKNEFITFKKSNIFYIQNDHIGKLVSLSLEKFLNQSPIKIEAHHLHTLTGHTRLVPCLLFLPNGNLLSGSHDCLIKIWDCERGVLISELQGHKHCVMSLALLTNGFLLSAAYNNDLKIWDLSSNRLIKTLNERASERHRGVISGALALRNGLFANNTFDDTIKIWSSDMTRDRSLLTIESPDKRQKELESLFCGMAKLSNDYLVTCSSKQDAPSILRVWNPLNGKLVLSHETNSSVVRKLCALDDDRVVASFQDGSLKIFNLADPDQTRSLETTCNVVEALVQTPNGYLIAAGHDRQAQKNKIEFWDLRDLKLVHQIDSGHKERIYSTCVSPDGKMLATSSADTFINLWNLSFTPVNEIHT